MNHAPLDLSGADLPGARLAGIDFGGANLTDANLAEADLSEANLFGASLVRAKLRGANLPGVLMRKADLRKADLSEANLTGADLENADLAEANLEKAKFGAANLSAAGLAGAKATGADLGSAKLRGADLHGAVLAGAVLSGADLQKANLVGTDLSGADLSGADLRKATLRAGKPGEAPPPAKEGAPPEARARLEGAKLKGADLRETDLAGFDFTGADLRDVRLDGVCLADAVFTSADLGGTQFEEADLSGCNFMGVRFDSTTVLRRAKVKGARVDRHTLESLKDYGGLTPGDRMQMKILDGVSLLRSHYSGFWQYIHIFALVLFAYPYLWFVFYEYGFARTGAADLGEQVRVVGGTGAHEFEAKVKSNPLFGGGGGEESYPLPKLKERKTVPIWEAFCRFVWNGGTDWQKGFILDKLSFGLFVFSFCYNLTRFVMVFKTKELELQQETTGLPVPVSALGFWGRMVHIMEIGFCINVVVVLVHTFHFLQHPIVFYVDKI